MTNEGIATITIGPDYFKRNAKKDYSNPLEFVWIREALQNSLDAGATEVKIHIDEDNNLFLDDNGCGMNRDIIMNKLLVLGGTHKAEGAVGGFGKAKEILFFCWENWSIQTSMNGVTYYVDKEMIGKHPITMVEDDDDPTWRDTGTDISIQLSDDEGTVETWKEAIKSYVATISTDAKITLEDEELKTLKLRGKRKPKDWCEIVIDENSEHKGMMFVRVRGVTMFTRKLSNVKALIIIELDGESVDFLSGNRDSLVYPYRSKLEEIINEFMIDPLTAVKVLIQPKIETYAGIDIMDKLIDLPVEIFDELIRTLNNHTTGGITNFAKMSEDFNKAVEDIAPEHKDAVMKAIEEEHESVGPMGYQFYVERDGAKKPNLKIESKRVQTVLHYWTSIIMELERRYPTHADLGVGLTFRSGVNAEVIRIKGKKVLLVNPNLFESTSSKIALGVEVYGEAAHEFAHLRHSYHDEEFANLMTILQRELGKNWNDWYQLFIEAKKEVLEAF